MKNDEYVKMNNLENTHFWFVGKRYFIKSYLDLVKNNIKNILDIGCGTGGTTKFLEKYGKVSGLEKNLKAIKYSRKKGIKVLRGEIEKIPFKKNMFDLVTVLDVLYHRDVKNLDVALNEIYRVLKPNGYVLITDSAFNFLKGAHSLSVKEKRRFTTREIKSLLAKNGFVIIKSSYVFLSIFLMVFIKRAFFDRIVVSNDSDVKPIPWLINLILISLFKLEALVMKYIDLPFGTSLIVLAKKNG